MVIKVIVLAWLGLAFGSFVNAFVWRIHEKKDWVRTRSQCPNCGHQLAPKDLVPVFSWLALRGRCRYCHKPISWQYPIVELAGAFVFVFSDIFWPGGVYGIGEVILFITWLAVSIGLLALLVYDFRWLILPNKILYPTALVAVIGRVVYLIGFEPRKLHGILLWLLSIAVASGIFWILFTISRGRWIGYGDVRLGLISGTLLATPARSLLMLFLASILGTLFVLPALATGRKHLTSKLPFGPFLITATAISLLFGDSIISWYKHLFLP